MWIPFQVKERIMKAKSKTGSWVFAVLASIGLVAALVNIFIDNMPKGDAQKVEDYKPWDKETIDLMASLPVQDGGRVKPFSTFAGFEMLGLHGARSMKVQDKAGVVYKIKPTEWLMDTVFRPQMAIKLPTFRIDNSKVLQAIDVEQKGRRDRYSYEEIVEGRQKLIELAQSYEPIEKKKRDPVQQQTIDLAYNIRNYEALLGYFGFARIGVVLEGTGKDGAPDDRRPFSEVISLAPSLMPDLEKMRLEGGQIPPRLLSLLQQIEDGANFSKFGLFMIPPVSASEEDWKTAGNVIMEVMTLKMKDPQEGIEDIKAIELAVLELARGEKPFREAIEKLKVRIETRAEARNEMKFISMEVMYFKRDLFLNALVLFLIGTISSLAMWVLSQSPLAKGFYWVTLTTTVIAVLMCVVAIVMRCIIMQRAPVGNLYDTVIFIGTTGVIISLLIEWISRNRFSLGLSPVLGTILILLARRYEVGDAGDHLDPLVAVLDSNFWLSTHVISITLGYTSGLLAAMLSCAYVLMRGLNLDGENKELRRSLTKAVYGCICLTVFLSLVGTVLGGIWANYSWGRFWGWDPKENGALMIVLWTLAILHARLGGIIKDWGLHFSSLFTACVVAFSWWHVNFLDTGLHSYGFTADKKSTVFIFYGTIMVVILYGVAAMLMEKYSSDQKTLKPVKNGEFVKS
jgi:ABC-type transport system involved in cytochrome c biogenesis permease subunit